MTTQQFSMLRIPTGRVCINIVLMVSCTNSHDVVVASGFVARETIELSNLTLANQVFALVNNSNVTLTDMSSGIMGLGFPRLSSISTSVPNGLSPPELITFFADRVPLF